MTGKACTEKKIADFTMRSDDGIMVKRVELIMAHPGIRHARTGKLGNPMGDHRQDLLVPYILCEAEVVHVYRCIWTNRRTSDEVVLYAVGAEVDTRWVDG